MQTQNTNLRNSSQMINEFDLNGQDGIDSQGDEIHQEAYEGNSDEMIQS
jgi:hypothetical protein